MARAECSCDRLWWERHREGCPRRNNTTPAEDVLTALYARHDFSVGEWVAWPEFMYIDLYAVRFWNSGIGRCRIAYEIKVSRADFLQEIRKPEKRARAMEISEQFYFAAPKGLIKPAEIPSDCGLVEVDAEGRSRAKVKAPFRESRWFSEEEVYSLLRRDLFKSGADVLRRRVRMLESNLEFQTRHFERTREELGEAREKLRLYEGAVLGV